MTTYNSAYETTATQGFVMQKIMTALKEALYSSEVRQVEGWPIFMVEGCGRYGEAVPSFAHPLAFPYKGYGDEKEEQYIAVDMRAFGRFDQRENEFVVGPNKVQYNLALTRAKLTSVWINRDKEILRDVSQMPMAVYSAWISENIARRYALDPQEQFTLAILAGVFYYSLFHDEPELDERNQMRVVNAIARGLRCQTADVMKVTDQVSVIPNMTAFCEKAAEIASPIRLDKLSAGVLITLLGFTWYGTNDKEMLAVAIEHPPTWIAMLMGAASERYYHNTQLAKLVERFSKNDIGKNFMHSVLKMLDVVNR